MNEFIAGLNPNEATLLSGLMSMIGGALGAFGAYVVAKHQMNKTKEKDNENRLIDLKVMKLDETIRNFNDLKLLINSTNGYVNDINNAVLVIRGQKSILNNTDINLQYLKNINEVSSKLESTINKINVNKWYIKNIIELNQLYKLRSEYLNVLIKFSTLFSGIENTIKINEFYNKFEICKSDYDSNFARLKQFVEKVVLMLEEEVEKILSNNK